MRPDTKTRAVAWGIGSASFCAYMASYMGRNILSAFMPRLIEENAFGIESLGLMGGAFMLSYGLGQLVNGLLGDKINAKYMVASGLFLSGIVMAAFPFCRSAAEGLALWTLCGFANSMLWGPLTRLVGENSNARTGMILMTSLTFASVVGAAAAYGMAALLPKATAWSFGFGLTGVFMVLVAVGFFIAAHLLEKTSRSVRESRRQPAKRHKNGTVNVLTAGFLLMTAVCMMNGVIRNAVAFWSPTFLSEALGWEASAAAGASALMPVLNITVTFLSIYALRYVGGDERRMNLWLFSLASLSFFCLYVLRGGHPLISMAALFTACAAMAGVNNMIFCVFVLRFQNSGNLSSVAGFLNFTAYLSASAASAVFSKMSIHGWNTVLAIWLITSLAGTIMSYLSARS